MDIIKKASVYILIFIVTTFLLFIFLWNRKNELENVYLSQKTGSIESEFSATLEGFDKVIGFFFYSFVDNDDLKKLMYEASTNKEAEDVYRKRFIQLLSPEYEILKIYNIRYLHFYFPDGTTFVRFHRLNRYGDKVQILKNTQRTIGGFRYIYPLFYNKLLIGNVEIAVSFGAVRKELNRLFNREHRFLIKKEFIFNKLFIEERKNYVQSDLSKDFFYEQDPNFKPIERIKPEILSQINIYLKERIQEYLKKKKPFYDTVKNDGIYYTVSFIPIYAVKELKKDYIGYLVTYEKDSAVGVYLSDFWISFTAISSVVFLLLFTAFLVSYIKEKIFVEEAESIDELTDAYNEKTFMSILSAELERSKRYDRPLSLILINFPSLKKLSYEQKTEALKSITGILMENIRDTDYLAHIDDTQLAILTPETKIEEANNLAERLKDILFHTHIEDIGIPEFYIGITEAHIHDSTESLLKRAREALFLAEEKGEGKIETTV